MNKKCPPTFPSCLDSSCQGDPAQGCLAGINIGCNCTGPAYPKNQTTDSCPSLESLYCSNLICQGFGKPAVCSNNVTAGCPCQNGIPDPSESQECLSDLYCYDSSCKGSFKPGAKEGYCTLDPHINCGCQVRNLNLGTSGTSAHCPSNISCSDSTCQSLDRGDVGTGHCDSDSLDGCICQLTSTSLNIDCPSQISCSDSRCQSLDKGDAGLGRCNSASLNGCFCYLTSISSSCPTSIACSAQSCQGSRDGSGKGVCRAQNTSGCVCQ